MIIVIIIDIAKYKKRKICTQDSNLTGQLWSYRGEVVYTKAPYIIKYYLKMHMKHKTDRSTYNPKLTFILGNYRPTVYFML